MSDTFKITLAQLNPTVGDLNGNADKAFAAWKQGKHGGADLVALPEMFITGYNAQDLISKPAFHMAAIETIQRLAQACAEGPALAIGGPWKEGSSVFNAYFILHSGQIKSVVEKHHLPNESVFDEVRIFDSGAIGGPYSVGNTRIGSPICEDAWHEDVVETHAETGAEFLLIPNGSPYHRGKRDTRLNIMVSRVVESGLPLIYLNMVGGQDDQVF
ncbi:MAG: nitrilase-related carbon-nitrogen hydrolase, partial [Paracoccaceae bacterium]